MTYFNAGRDLNGVCFRCLTRDNGEFCKKCMKLYAKKTPKGGFVENHGNDPHFRELWEAK